MNKHIVILLLFSFQPLFAMDTIFDQSLEQAKRQAEQEYKKQRNRIFCGWDQFFVSANEDKKEETFQEEIKWRTQLVNRLKHEKCVGCGLMLCATTAACATTPFITDGEFMSNHPIAGACCCLISCGCIVVDAIICDRWCFDCKSYEGNKKNLDDYSQIKQFQNMGIKVEKVE